MYNWLIVRSYVKFEPYSNLFAYTSVYFLNRRANASTGLALEFTLQKTEWDTLIHVELLQVRVHVEKLHQSRPIYACCMLSRRYWTISSYSGLGRYFVTFFSMLPTVFLSFSIQVKVVGLLYNFLKNYVAVFYSRNKFEINSGELTE